MTTAAKVQAEKILFAGVSAATDDDDRMARVMCGCDVLWSEKIKSTQALCSVQLYFAKLFLSLSLSLSQLFA